LKSENVLERRLIFKAAIRYDCGASRAIGGQECWWVCLIGLHSTRTEKHFLLGNLTSRNCGKPGQKEEEKIGRAGRGAHKYRAQDFARLFGQAK